MRKITATVKLCCILAYQILFHLTYFSVGELFFYLSILNMVYFSQNLFIHFPFRFVVSLKDPLDKVRIRLMLTIDILMFSSLMRLSPFVLWDITDISFKCTVRWSLQISRSIAFHHPGEAECSFTVLTPVLCVFQEHIQIIYYAGCSS